MDEKEIVILIRNSFKAGQSHAEVTRKLQKKGYKLEYIDELIRKSGGISKGTWVFGAIFLTVLILAGVTYVYYFLPSGTIQELKNPLEGLIVNFGTLNPEEMENQTETYLEQIEITPEFFTYLLIEVGADSLKKEPFTGDIPTVNFEVGDQTFYSVVDGGIQTFEEENPEPDLTFILEKETLIRTIISDDIEETFKEGIESGNIEIEQNADQQTLLLKGYMTLYDSLTE